MSTSYYLGRNFCNHCRRTDEPILIGTLAAGWCFLLKIYPIIKGKNVPSFYPEQDINTLEDWQKFWVDGIITDEYGKIYTPMAMTYIITERSNPMRDWVSGWWSPGYESEEDFHRVNHSMRGPNGLLRSRFARPGEGPWDYQA